MSYVGTWGWWRRWRCWVCRSRGGSPPLGSEVWKTQKLGKSTPWRKVKVVKNFLLILNLAWIPPSIQILLWPLPTWSEIFEQKLWKERLSICVWTGCTRGHELQFYLGGDSQKNKNCPGGKEEKNIFKRKEKFKYFHLNNSHIPSFSTPPWQYKTQMIMICVLQQKTGPPMLWILTSL